MFRFEPGTATLYEMKHHASSGLLSCRTTFILLFGFICVYFGFCCGFFLRDSSGGKGGSSSSSSSSTTRGLRLPFGGLTEEEEEAAEKLRVRAELGSGAWTLMHRMAAGWEKSPTQAQMEEVVQFFHLMSKLYPCPDCAAHFRQLLAANPVDARDNKKLSVWLCNAHNQVNERLAKPLFSCELESLAKRWGSCGCFGNLTKVGESKLLDTKVVAGGKGE